MTAPGKRRGSRQRTAKNAFGDGPSALAATPGKAVAARRRGSKTAAPQAPEPAKQAPVVKAEPWPPPAPVLDGVPCVEMVALPLIGTLVVKVRGGGIPQIGTVVDYEEFHPTQYMFPVRWGASTTMEAVGPRTWELPRAYQPLGRRPPRRTGMCARLDREAEQKAAALEAEQDAAAVAAEQKPAKKTGRKTSPVAALPAPRSGALVVEGTVLRAVSA